MSKYTSPNYELREDSNLFRFVIVHKVTGSLVAKFNYVIVDREYMHKQALKFLEDLSIHELTTP
jgi:hypothetical protein